MTAAAATLDPRTTLARPDLAEQALEGVVRAKTFRAVRPMHCAVSIAPVWQDADEASEQIDQLLFGEIFDVLDARDDLVWGRARRDGLVGWVEASVLGQGAPRATHRVAALWADGDGPDGEFELPLNAFVVVEREDGDTAVLAGGDRMALADLAAIGEFERSPVDVAEQFIGTPHEMGGRSPEATDCSGMVQQALYACGLAGPRYASMQREIGEAVDPADARRGDLVLWDGHAGFLFGPGLVLHASGRHGEVLVEVFDAVDAAQREGGSAAPVFRRVV